MSAEVTDVDAATARVQTRRADVDARQQIDVPDRLVRSETPGDLGDVGHHLLVGEKRPLFVPVLRGGLGDRLFAEHEPPGLDLVVLGECLLRVPAAVLRVEMVLLHGANVEKGHRTVGTGDEHVAVVAAPLQHFLRGHGVAELRELLVGVDDWLARLGDFLRRDEVLAEDGTGEAVVRRLRREPANAREHVRLELAAALQEPLETVLVGIDLLERLVGGVVHETLELLLLVRRDRTNRHRFSPLHSRNRSGGVYHT